MNLRKFIAVLIMINLVPSFYGFLGYLTGEDFIKIFIGMHSIQGGLIVLILIFLGALKLFNK